jgi:hypothetical protein
MRCFEWKEGELIDGISMSDDNGLLLANNTTRVPLHSRNPATVYRGRVFDVYPFWVNPQDGSSFLTLAKPHEKHQNDPSILVHVSTHSDQDFPVMGFWRGMPEIVRTLHAATAETSALSWKEGLVTIAPSGVLRIRPEGHDDMWAIVNDHDAPYTETWIRHEARNLLREEGLL